MVASDLKTIGKPSNPIVAQLATMWPSHCLPGFGQQSNRWLPEPKTIGRPLKWFPAKKTLPSHHLKKLTIVLRVRNPVHPSKGKVENLLPHRNADSGMLREWWDTVPHFVAQVIACFFCGTSFVSRNGTEMFSRKYCLVKRGLTNIRFYLLFCRCLVIVIYVTSCKLWASLQIVLVSVSTYWKNSLYVPFERMQ